jgi:hypothetical protein
MSYGPGQTQFNAKHRTVSVVVIAVFHCGDNGLISVKNSHVFDTTTISNDSDCVFFRGGVALICCGNGRNDVRLVNLMEAAGGRYVCVTVVCWGNHLPRERFRMHFQSKIVRRFDSIGGQGTFTTTIQHPPTF